jgi:hypothetical protein
MKRAFILLVLAFLAAPGCMSMNPFKSTPVVKETPKPAPPPPVVIADEITPENAHQKADALSKELAYDASGAATTPVAPADAGKH